MTAPLTSGRIGWMPELRTRRMPVVAQDTGITYDGVILTASVAVPWEDLGRGPTGHRVQVVDYDATTRTMYAPAAIADGDEPKPSDNSAILANPGFHARNTYALVMRTLARFEFALGRRVSWYFRAHQLKVAPHAFEQMNAYYSREAEALVFGYFRRAGAPLFLCLSHDIVVHETAHALLDGLRSRFMAPSSPDQAAFHEGFADIVALLSVFALDEVVSQLIERLKLDVDREHEGDLPDGLIPRSAVTAESLQSSVLLGLAEDMDAES